YNGSRGDTPYDRFSTVPTAAERTGDFTDLQGANLFYPNINGCAFAGQTITSKKLIDSSNACTLQLIPIAQGLLQYIPLLNVPGASAGTQNFHFVTSTNNSSDDFNFRLNRSFGATQQRQRGNAGRGGFFGGRGNNLSVGIHYHGANS